MMYSEDGRSSAIILDGGCYQNNEPVYYTRALPDKLYKLEFVPVEVRSKFDPYTALTSEDYKVQVECSIISYISFLLFIVALIFAILTFVLCFKAKVDIGDEGKKLRI